MKLPTPDYHDGEGLDALGFRIIEVHDKGAIIGGPSETFAGNCCKLIYEAPERLNIDLEDGSYRTFQFVKYFWRDYGGGSEVEHMYYEPLQKPRPKFTLIRGGL